MSTSEQPPTAKVKEDVKTLSNEVSRISSIHDLYLTLADQKKVDTHVLNPAPAFFARIFESTETEIILSLAKLYGVENSNRNLVKLVEYAESNRTEIEWGYEEITQHKIEEHRERLDKQKGVVEEVIDLRNEFYADYSADYLLVAEDLTADYPLEVEEVETLLDVAESILEDYHRALAGRDIANIERMDVDRVLHALGEYYKGGDYKLATKD